MSFHQDLLPTNGPLGRRRFRVGSWTADPQVNEIASGERTVKLEPKVMGLLVFLAERPGQTVSRDELLEGLWDGAAVVEEALTRCVSQLRRALADDPQDPKYIQTVSKRGYRLVAPVVVDESRRFEGREPVAAPPEPKLAIIARGSDESLEADDGATESTGSAGDPLGGMNEPPKRMPAPQRRHSSSIVIGLLAVALVAALIPAALFFRSSASSRLDVRFNIDVPEMPNPYDIALSPDGRYVAYVAAAGKGSFVLWVRAVNSLEARPLPHTEGATEPFWSPDGKYLAYGVLKGTGAVLQKVDVSAGTVQTVADLGSGNFCCGTWNREGIIVFSHGGVLHRVSASGGEATTISTLDASRNEVFHARPQFLPDGRRFLYLVWSSRPENRAIHVGSLDSETVSTLMAAESNVVYAPAGFLLFLKNRTLMARPIDASRLEFTGEAILVAPNIVLNAVGAIGAFAASDEGTLIYRSESPGVGERRWLWLDRVGRPDGAREAGTAAMGFRLSPDGKQAAFTDGSGGAGGIWIHDFERNLKTRLMSGPAGGQVWSPDGSRLIVGSGPIVGRTLHEKSSNGALPEQALVPPEPGYMVPVDWSADSKFVVFVKGTTGTMRDLWIMPLADRKPFPYLITPDDEPHAALSPDGRWLAYVSSESGAYQVVVRSFPDPSAGRWQITAEGGICPRWKGDGAELYYVDSAGAIVAAPVKSGPTFEVGAPTTLFRTRLDFPQVSAYSPLCPYDVTRDGRRFLISEPGTPVPISVILDWTSTL